MKNNRGFFAILLVSGLSVAMIPMILMMTQSISFMSQMNARYSSLNNTNALFLDIKDALNNYDTCFNTFKDSKEVTEIKNSKNEVIYGPELFNSAGVQFKKATLKIKLPLKEINTSDTSTAHASTNSELEIEVFSEPASTTKLKTIPIYIEAEDSQGSTLIKCSTSKPAIYSLKCEQTKVSKTCCRYHYNITISERDLLTAKSNEHPPIYMRTDEADECLPTPYDSNCESAAEECKNADVELKAYCYKSYWNYIVKCK